jgi:hypothetical protein
MFATVLRPVLYAISLVEVLTLIASVIGLVVWLGTMVWRGLTLITKTEPPKTLKRILISPELSPQWKSSECRGTIPRSPNCLPAEVPFPQA